MFRYQVVGKYPCLDDDYGVVLIKDNIYGRTLNIPLLIGVYESIEVGHSFCSLDEFEDDLW